MVEYRPFRNADPPQFVQLWEAAGLGRGAVAGHTADTFEFFLFSQPFFDPAGMIFACEGERIVGMVHAGFGTNVGEAGLDKSRGVICALIVHPRFRRQGIARELLRRAETYLQAAGVTTILAGSAQPNDPFYSGLYGGCQSAGFLLSDLDADPFFTHLGYQPLERHIIYHREVGCRGEPTSLRLMSVRRNSKLSIPDPPLPRSWWWETRIGRLDPLEMALAPKNEKQPVARVNVLGLDLFAQKWGTRAIGLVDLRVAETHRRKGYGQAMLCEVCRRVKDEAISLVEAHAPENDLAATGVLKSAGFKPVDTGVVYQKR